MLARGRAIDTINARCGLIRRFVEFTNGYVRRLKTRATLAVNLIEQRVGHAQWLPALAAHSRSSPTLLVHFRPLHPDGVECFKHIATQDL
jgi:hypothetical protein